ncbi:A24 family peptidase [Sporosarcina pasteurii]|uniref:Leader peptidase pppA n=1 Tax=Sporosarcina pasteurii TaxID=1474 RepID=A0A380BWJ0_SPOPA|nr:A24 family peptidase [Sporosarcina pasteurii]MDS9471331.1 prepilin peptidase [Sporosarcina pasteurii]QBQ05041.1 prepilin peptidase [Sporosarcina pasteurii]SUJ07809.1 Leader peptidase pppA [Sporosarcina pasteurii]
MELLIGVLFFIYGLIFGSFFNVVGLRVPKKASISFPPSHCTACERRLGVLDLVPVFSYLFLKGRCRTCSAKISPIYPFMELMTGILFALAYGMLGLSLELIVAIVFISLLIIITVTDLAYMLIPNKILFPFGIVLFLLRFISPLTPWWSSIVGAVIGFGVLLVIAVISKGGMGGGDIKLFLVIGLVIGPVQTLLTLFIASLIGTIVGFIFLKRTKQGRKTPIPFGPSISAAAVIVYFWGSFIVDWYGKLFV